MKKISQFQQDFGQNGLLGIEGPKGIAHHEFENNKKLFISSYKKYIVDIEDKILNMEIELEGFLINLSNKKKSNRGIESYSFEYFPRSLFEQYLYKKQSLKKLYKELAECNDIYVELFGEIKNEGNGNK